MTSDITTSIVSSMHPVVSSLKTANYTIVNGDYFIGIGTLSSNIIISLPSSPSTSDQYIIKDVNGTVGDGYIVTIDGNGNDIDGQVTFILAQNYSSITVVYTGAQWSVCLSYAGEQNGNGYGTYANRPLQGQSGRTYYAIDQSMSYYDNGLSWIGIGPTYVHNLPFISDFSWINQGGATAIDTGSGILFDAPTNSSAQNCRLLVQSTPSVPYSITVFIFRNKRDMENNKFGLWFRQSSNGKLVGFHIDSQAASGIDRISVSKYDNQTTHNSDYISPTAGTYSSMSKINWFRITDDSTNRICSYSEDGKNFTIFHSVSRTDFLTADQVGIGSNYFDGTGSVLITNWLVE